jgi:hypothetical protein
VATKRPPTIGTLADQLYAKREMKRKLEEQVKLINEEIAALTETAIETMDAQNTTKGEGKLASLSISSNVVANVLDWDQVWPWIARTKSFHMVQKRLNDASYREVLDMGKQVPGVQPFTKRNLSVRSL